MISESFRFLKARGFQAYIGFPNDESYPLYIGTKLMSDIGKMYTYVLPYRIGGVKRKLRVFNLVSRCFCLLYTSMCSIFASKKVVAFQIQKAHESFDEYRYRHSDYKVVELNKGRAYYIVSKHEGVRTAFIVDVTEKSAKSFQRTVREILKREKHNMDLILYVGNLPFSSHGLIKVPRKFEPKNFFFTGRVLDNQAIDKELFFNFNSWDVNLSNYDLI
jgi:hypothetical protein